MVKKQAILFILALFTISSAHALAEDDSRRGGGRDLGPPPEAYAACEGKESGDQAGFTSPHGDTVTGTCEQEGNRLVLRPDHRPERRKGGQQGREEN